MAGLNSFDIVQMTMVGRLFGQEVLNVFHYRIGDPSTTGDPYTAIKNWTQYWNVGAASPVGPMLDVMTAEYALLGIRGQRVWPTRDRYYFQTLDLPGLHAGTCLSPNQSAALEKFTGAGSRRGVGGVRIAAIPSSEMEDGVFKPGYRTLLKLITDRFPLIHSTTLESTTGVMEVTSKTSYGVTNPVIGGNVKDTARVMRRRTIGVGR